MIKNAYREITRLIPEDIFLVEQRVKDDFNFPVHFHPEYELNFIYRGKGVRRIVGDHTDEIDDLELVLVGPNVVHGWTLHNCANKGIYEITIHIHNDLFDKKMLSRRIFKPIFHMLERAKYGILFSRETTNLIMPRLMVLSQINGLQHYLEFVSVLNALAISQGQKSLSISSREKDDFQNNDKFKKVYDYIQNNFSRTITLDEISKLVNMTPVTFNRFIKRTTAKTFIHYLNDTRISLASRWLLENELSIGEISIKCGFNNIANFNRLFKQSKNLTPKEFKKQFIGLKKEL